jgi:hypothetical protein
MKKWDELTEAQRENAIAHELTQLLTDVIEGVRFNDEANGDTLQAAIDAAGEAADAMQTPWFVGEFILDAEYTTREGKQESVRTALESMARAAAEDAIYLEPGEYATYLKGE